MGRRVTPSRLRWEENRQRVQFSTVLVEKCQPFYSTKIVEQDDRFLPRLNRNFLLNCTRWSYCIPRWPSGTTRACSGPQVILLPPVREHRSPSFGSTWKTKDNTCERYALSALYPRPERRGFAARLVKLYSLFSN